MRTEIETYVTINLSQKSLFECLTNPSVDPFLNFDKFSLPKKLIATSSAMHQKIWKNIEKRWYEILDVMCPSAALSSPTDMVHENCDNKRDERQVRRFNPGYQTLSETLSQFSIRESLVPWVVSIEIS